MGYWGGIGAVIAFIFFGLLTWFLLQIRLSKIGDGKTSNFLFSHCDQFSF